MRKHDASTNLDTDVRTRTQRAVTELTGTPGTASLNRVNNDITIRKTRARFNPTVHTQTNTRTQTLEEVTAVEEAREEVDQDIGARQSFLTPTSRRKRLLLQRSLRLYPRKTLHLTLPHILFQASS